MKRSEYMRALRRHKRKRLALVGLLLAMAFLVAGMTTTLVIRVSQAAEALPSTSLPARPATTTRPPSTTTATAVAPTALSTTSTAPSTSTTTIYTHEIPDPIRIVIPAIEVDAEVISVGLLENGDMDVPPFGLAGWYNLGPAPGAKGPAVIVAHVDTKKGPDVFYHLKELEPDDEILVYGEDGDVATFVVESKEQQLKSELPTDRIWDDTWEPVIRLITCGGEFDRHWGHYLSNVIVYGHLVK
jgi:sortase (surface protein transpeptidase)